MRDYTEVVIESARAPLRYRLHGGHCDGPGFPLAAADDPGLDTEPLPDPVGCLVEQGPGVDQDQGRGPEPFGQVQGDDGFARTRACDDDTGSRLDDGLDGLCLIFPGLECARSLERDLGQDRVVGPVGVVVGGQNVVEYAPGQDQVIAVE